MSFWSKKLYIPTTGAWQNLSNPQVDSRVSFLRVLNLSLDEEARVAIGISDTTSSTLSDPSGLTLSEIGTAGHIKYEYCVTAINANGQETNASNIVSTTTGNATINTTNYHTLSWSAVTGTDGYRIYCRRNDTDIYVATVASNIVTYTNNGSMALSNRWPWINMTGIESLIVWTTLSPGVGLEVLDRPLQMPTGDTLKIYTTGPITVYSCGEV